MIDTPSPKTHPKVARPNKESSIPREVPVKEWVLSEVDESLAKEHVKSLCPTGGFGFGWRSPL
jgi:hypothetical protein